MTTQKPKIAIITIRNTYNYGGVFSSLKAAHDFCSIYFQPTVFFLSFDNALATSIRSFKFTSNDKPLSYFGMNSFEIGARWAFWEPGHYAFTLPSWKKALKDFDYFLVVSGTCIAAHPLVLLNKRFTMWIGTPYNEDRSERVKGLQGIYKILNSLAEKHMNAIEKKILEQSSYTWAISSYAQQKFESILEENRKTLVCCGYPIGQNSTIQNRKKDDIIVAVGRFADPRKNISMLLKTFQRIYERMPAIKLYVIGLKPSSETLQPFASHQSFKNVIFTGPVSNADLVTFFKRAKLKLITSYQEGLGIVGLEALLHETPVIATDCGGTKDYVIDGKTGYLVAIDDDKTMSEKVLHILNDEALRLFLAKNGKELVEQKFSKSYVYQQFKNGLSTTYPELTAWFDTCDRANMIQPAQKETPPLKSQSASL